MSVQTFERQELTGKFSLMVSIFIALCVVPSGFVGAAEYRVSTTDIAYPTKYLATTFMTRVYAELGHTLTILEYPQARALIESNAGRVDGELFRVEGINDRHKNLIRVPGAIAYSRIFAYVRKDSKLTPEKWADLKGLRVGHVIGAKIVERRLQGIQSLGVQRPEQLFSMVKTGRLDVAVYADTMMKIPDTVTPIETPLARVPVFHYIHNKNQQLLVPLQNTIQRLTERGELECIISSPAGEDAGDHCSMVLGK